MDWHEAFGRLREIREAVAFLGNRVGELVSRDPDLPLDAIRGSFTSLQVSLDAVLKRLAR